MFSGTSWSVFTMNVFTTVARLSFTSALYYFLLIHRLFCLCVFWRFGEYRNEHPCAVRALSAHRIQKAVTRASINKVQLVMVPEATSGQPALADMKVYTREGTQSPADAPGVFQAVKDV